jgi:hypothetical protein
VRKSLLTCLMVLGGFFSASAAHANTVTYILTLTPQQGYTLSGNGTLTFTDGPVTSPPPFGLFNVDTADITTLSISIGGFSFNLLGEVSALQFTDGVLSDLTAGAATNGAASLSASATTAVYFDNLATGGISSHDTITAALQITPLPATLPFFASGLGFVGYLAKRHKRSAKQALVAA